MALADGVPGMKPGSTIRNAALALGYLITAPLWLALFPFLLGVFVWRDTSGWAGTLSQLPGIDADGGLVSGVVALVYGLVLFAAIGAAYGGGNGGSAAGPPADGQAAVGTTPTAGAAASANTATMTATATTATQAPTAEPTPTATATLTETPTSTPTPTSTAVPTETPVVAVVEYDGEWQGSLTITRADGSSESRSISGSGDWQQSFDADVTSVAINAQKQDDSSATLRVALRRGGETIAESETSAEYGLAQVSQSFF